MNYHKLAELGYVPSKGYGYMKLLPEKWKLPKTCPDDVFKLMPLHLQIRYSTVNDNGFHSLNEYD